MMFNMKLAAMLAAMGMGLSNIPSVMAQTFTDCNPLESCECIQYLATLGWHLVHLQRGL